MDGFRKQKLLSKKEANDQLAVANQKLANALSEVQSVKAFFKLDILQRTKAFIKQSEAMQILYEACMESGLTKKESILFFQSVSREIVLIDFSDPNYCDKVDQVLFSHGIERQDFGDREQVILDAWKINKEIQQQPEQE